MAKKYITVPDEYGLNWNRNNVVKMSVSVQKDDKEIIKAHAKENGEPVNSFILRAIDDTMLRDHAGKKPIEVLIEEADRASSNLKLQQSCYEEALEKAENAYFLILSKLSSIYSYEKVLDLLTRFRNNTNYNKMLLPLFLKAGYAYQNKGDYSKAKEFFEKAISSDIEYYDSSYEYYDIIDWLKRYKRGAQDLDYMVGPVDDFDRNSAWASDEFDPLDMEDPSYWNGDAPD